MLIKTDAEKNEYRHVWVIAEQSGGVVKRVTFELLGAARRLATARGGEVWCVLFGHGLKGQAERCFQHQADTVLVVDDPALAKFVDDTYASVLTRMIRKYKPEIVLCGATCAGRGLIPRVAVQCEAGLTADCTGLEIDPDTGVLLQTRPAFGGNIMATIKSMNHRPQMATVRPRVMEQPQPEPGRTGRLLAEKLQPGDVSGAMRVLELIAGSEDAVSLADAHFIVAGGRGVKSKEGFALLNRFAHLIGGAVGASRAAVDAGWINYAHQVGQTGQTVQPRVYMACGVSGQIQHLVGMQSANLIIAINKNPDAPIMKLADYAIVGDLFEVLPALIGQLQKV